jgi:hypothetical protein
LQTGIAWDGVLLGLKSFVLPFVIAAVGLLCLHWVGRRHEKAPAMAAIPLLAAILAGIAAANYERWAFPPDDVAAWLPLLALASFIVLSPLESIRSARRIWFFAQFALVAVTMWIILPPVVVQSGVVAVASWLVVLIVLWLVFWIYIDSFLEPRKAGVALTLTAGALGFVVALGGSIVIGVAATSIFGALAGWLAISLIAGWIPLSRALLGCVTLLFGSVTTASYFYAEMSPWMLAPVVAAPFFVRLAYLARNEEGHPLREVAIGGFSAMTPLAVAIGMAIWSYFRQVPY